MFIRKIIFKIAVKCRASEKTLHLISPSLFGLFVTRNIAKGFEKGMKEANKNFCSVFERDKFIQECEKANLAKKEVSK